MESLSVDEHEQDVDTPSEEMNFTHLTCRDCGTTNEKVLYSEMQDAVLCDECFYELPVPQEVIDEAKQVTKEAVDKWNRGVYTELDEAIEDRKNRNPEVYREPNNDGRN